MKDFVTQSDFVIIYFCCKFFLIVRALKLHTADKFIIKTFYKRIKHQLNFIAKVSSYNPTGQLNSINQQTPKREKRIYRTVNCNSCSASGLGCKYELSIFIFWFKKKSKQFI